MPTEDPGLPLEEQAPPVFAPSMVTNFDSLSGLSGANVPWGPTNYISDDANRPIACIDLQELYGKYEAHFIAPDSNKVYLTFDEGYENGYTASILDTLKEKNVSAVFFVTLPYAKGNPELIHRMIDEGHVIGNHSCTHPNFTAVSLDKAFEEVKGLHDYMEETYDYTMGLFRCPEGAFTEQTLALFHQIGYKSVFWSFAYADWDANNQPDPAAALEKIKGWSHPGAIYLLHAVSSTNDQILGELIDWWQAEGYEISPYDFSSTEQIATE